MTIYAALVLGVLIGWVIEWVIDWAYWRRKTRNLAAKLADVEARTADMQTDNVFLKGKVASLEADAAQFEGVKGELESKSVALEANAGEFETIQGELENKIASLESEVHELEGEVGGLENERSRLQARISELESQAAGPGALGVAAAAGAALGATKLFGDEEPDFRSIPEAEATIIESGAPVETGETAKGSEGLGGLAGPGAALAGAAIAAAKLPDKPVEAVEVEAVEATMVEAPAVLPIEEAGPPAALLIEETVPDAAETTLAPGSEEPAGAITEILPAGETELTGNVDVADFAEMAKFKNALEYVEGIGPVFAEKLRAIGLITCLDFLKAGSTRKGREELVEKSGISAKLIMKWVNHIDLYRVKGIGSEYADLLEASGVDTVVELAQRNPANLFAKMTETNTAKELVRKLPTAGQVEDWVGQAKSLPRVVSY